MKLEVGEFVRFAGQHGIVEARKASLAKDWHDAIVVHFPGGVPEALPTRLRSARRAAMDEGTALAVLDWFEVDAPASPEVTPAPQRVA